MWGLPRGDNPDELGRSWATRSGRFTESCLVMACSMNRQGQVLICWDVAGQSLEGVLEGCLLGGGLCEACVDSLGSQHVYLWGFPKGCIARQS